MKEVNFYLMITIAYIMVLVGIAIGQIGQVSECNEDPVDWAFSLFVFILLIVPSALSYLAGRKDMHDK